MITTTLAEDLRFLGVAVASLDRSAGYFTVFIAEIINRIEDETGHTIAPAITDTARLGRLVQTRDAR